MSLPVCKKHILLRLEHHGPLGVFLMYPSLLPLELLSDNEKWSWWYDPFYPFHFYVCTQIVKSRCGSLLPLPLFLLARAPRKKKKVMIESLHGSHVLIGLLSYHYYTTTTLDSVVLSLSRIVSDMKREGLYELLFYTQSCLTLPKNESSKGFWPMKSG